MSELHNTQNATNIRQTLLATASAFALVAYASLPQAALAADKDRPTIWIEGGWHFESVSGDADPFVPPLDAEARATGLPSLTAIENSLGRTYGAEGSISFQPKGSDWVFIASARYGRSQTTRRIISNKIVAGPPLKKSEFQSGAFSTVTITPTFAAYASHSVNNSEAHAIADFQVGKDIGIGLLGHGTDTVIGFGARYAQMNAKSKAHSYANPDVTFSQGYVGTAGFHKYYIKFPNHRSAALAERTDNLHALGPSLSLKNTTELLGTVDEGQVALDWGVNAAVLFGRQKAKTSHHSTVSYVKGTAVQSVNAYPPVNRTRSRMVVIPNIGGFAALSYRFPNAKLSAGYRADFFFGARDSGFETRSTADVGFHGPFATISIGLGR
jgi:hypothetical protein